MRSRSAPRRTSRRRARASHRRSPAMRSSPSRPMTPSAPAVEHLHLLLRVAIAGGGARGDSGLDPLAVLGRQLDGERAERLVEAVTAPGADQRHDVVAAIEHPGDGELRDGDAALAGDRAQRLDELEVALDVALREAWAVGAEVAGALGAGRPVAADEAAGEHAVGGDADAELPAGRKDLGLDAPADQRVLDLQIADRRDRVGAADRVRADV